MAHDEEIAEIDVDLRDAEEIACGLELDARTTERGRCLVESRVLRERDAAAEIRKPKHLRIVRVAAKGDRLGIGFVGLLERIAPNVRRRERNQRPGAPHDTSWVRFQGYG